MTSTQRAFLYTQLADDLERQIATGVYLPGDRIPSVRELKRERGLSLATVTHALAELEARGWIEARPRKGYFVRIRDTQSSLPVVKSRRMRPRQIPTPHLADELVTASARPSLVPLGGAVLAPELLPLKHLSRLMRDATRGPRAFARYGPPAGEPELRRAVARHLLNIRMPASADEVVVTSGCMNAIHLALLAVARRGDTVIVESPTFFGFLQLIRDLGLYALEVPSDPQSGIDLASLDQALRGHDAKAIIVTPNFQNPTGALMPLAHKSELLVMAAHHGVPIIEDDIYGDLYFGERRPPPLASLDPDADVVYCSSFSKTLTPGLRIGYMLPRLHADPVHRSKLSSTIASPPLSQLVIAELLAAGAYTRHLRRLREQLETQMAAARQSLIRHLPSGTQVSAPEGGFLLWVRAPVGVDTLAVLESMKQSVSFLPGALCASDDRYKRYLRISAGHPWSPRFERAVKRLGRAVAQ